MVVPLPLTIAEKTRGVPDIVEPSLAVQTAWVDGVVPGVITYTPALDRMHVTRALPPFHVQSLPVPPNAAPSAPDVDGQLVPF